MGKKREDNRVYTQKLFSKPQFGWSVFALDGFKKTVSYMTDVPFDVLDCFENYKQNGYAVCKFECEGSGDFVLIFIHGFGSFIIVERTENLELVEIKTSIEDIVENAIDCFEEDINDWIDFMCGAEEPDMPMDEEVALARVIMTTELVEKMENVWKLYFPGR